MPPRFQPNHNMVTRPLQSETLALNRILGTVRTRECCLQEDVDWKGTAILTFLSLRLAGYLRTLFTDIGLLCNNKYKVKPFDYSFMIEMG